MDHDGIVPGRHRRRITHSPGCRDVQRPRIPRWFRRQGRAHVPRYVGPGRERRVSPVSDRAVLPAADRGIAVCVGEGADQIRHEALQDPRRSLRSVDREQAPERGRDIPGRHRREIVEDHILP